MKSLKKACKLHKCTPNQLALEVLDVLTPKAAIFSSFTRLARKFPAQGRNFPRYLEEQWGIYSQRECIVLDLHNATADERIGAIGTYNLKTLGTTQVRAVTLTMDEILTTGDPLDTYLIKFLVGGLLDLKKYTYTKKYNVVTNICRNCNQTGSQRHYVEECTLMQEDRENFRKEVAKRVTNFNDSMIFEFVSSIKHNLIWTGMTKEERATLLRSIKEYITAAHKKLKDHLTS